MNPVFMRADAIAEATQKDIQDALERIQQQLAVISDEGNLKIGERHWR